MAASCDMPCIVEALSRSARRRVRLRRVAVLKSRWHTQKLLHACGMSEEILATRLDLAQLVDAFRCNCDAPEYVPNGQLAMAGDGAPNVEVTRGAFLRSCVDRLDLGIEDGSSTAAVASPKGELMDKNVFAGDGSLTGPSSQFDACGAVLEAAKQSSESVGLTNSEVFCEGPPKGPSSAFDGCDAMHIHGKLSSDIDVYMVSEVVCDGFLMGPSSKLHHCGVMLNGGMHSSEVDGHMNSEVVAEGAPKGPSSRFDGYSAIQHGGTQSSEVDGHTIFKQKL